MARLNVMIGVLVAVLSVRGAFAQAVVTPDQARALIAEQRDFVTRMARGEITGARYTVRWFVNVRVYPNGRGETFLSPDDVTHYATIRVIAAKARFLSSRRARASGPPPPAPPGCARGSPGASAGTPSPRGEAGGSRRWTAPAPPAS